MERPRLPVALRQRIGTTVRKKSLNDDGESSNGSFCGLQGERCYRIPYTRRESLSGETGQTVCTWQSSAVTIKLPERGA